MKNRALTRRERLGLLAVAEGYREAAHVLTTRSCWRDLAEGWAYWHAQYGHLTSLARQLEAQADETTQ